MNLLLYPKESWISRRAAGIARTTGKPLHIARMDAVSEHWHLQEKYEELRQNTDAPILRFEPEDETTRQ